MSFNLLRDQLKPSEGEVLVRSYHCTTLSPVFSLIGLKTDGYLTVTNKRMVYFAEGSSLFGLTGCSKLYHELPLADVANLSLSRGTRFSFLRLLGAAVLGTLAAAFLAMMVVGVYLALRGMGGTDPNEYLLRLASVIPFIAVGGFTLLSFWVDRQDILRSALAATSLAIAVAISFADISPFGAVIDVPSAHATLMQVIAVGLLGYWLWCVYWFIRRDYLTLAVRSTTNWPPSIQVAGVSWWGRINVAADLAYGMAPAIDAEALFRELGAMVSDIQTLGDHGIAKWQQEERPTAATATPHQPRAGWRAAVVRPALVWTMAVVGFVAAEAAWHAWSKPGQAAAGMRREVAEARGRFSDSPAARHWTPKLLAKAEQEAAAGEAAFENRNFTDAMARWQVALEVYAAIPQASADLARAAELQAKYRETSTSEYLAETGREHVKAARVLKEYVALVDQHPRPTEAWRTAQDNAAAARGYDLQTHWDDAGKAWSSAEWSVTRANRLLHADLWLKQGGEAVKKGDGSAALSLAERALDEVPAYRPADQLRTVARAMVEYEEWLRSDFDSASAARETALQQFERYGGSAWGLAGRHLEEARAHVDTADWEKCGEAWTKVVNLMPLVVHQVRSARLEVEARRGNWATVADLAVKILRHEPNHARAAELKPKAEGILAASAAEAAYLRAVSGALAEELAADRIKVGDMNDFLAHLDRYGKEEWARVKETIDQARTFAVNEQGADCLTAWQRANDLLPAAYRRMRAEIWLEQAELAARSESWAKAVIYAERALKEKPDHPRARQLRDQAESMDSKPLALAR